jgi:hypothetical protein
MLKVHPAAHEGLTDNVSECGQVDQDAVDARHPSTATSAPGNYGDSAGLHPISETP